MGHLVTRMGRSMYGLPESAILVAPPQNKKHAESTLIYQARMQGPELPFVEHLTIEHF